MSVETEEIIRICEGLPVEKRIEIADFARFLAARQHEERWETLLSQTNPRPKLDAFLRESAREAETPLDPDQL